MKKLVEGCIINACNTDAIIEYFEYANRESAIDNSTTKVNNVYFFVETSEGNFSKVRISADTIKRLHSEIESLEKSKV